MDEKKIKIQGVEKLPVSYGDEAWAIPEDWVGENVIYSARGTMLLTNEGPILINTPGMLLQDLGTSILVQTEDGSMENLVPKCNIQQICKVSRIQRAVGPGGIML